MRTNNVYLDIRYWIIAFALPICGIPLVTSFLNFSESDNDSTTITATVFGGAERVSGSLTILKTPQDSWMIDCGLYYPELGPDGTAESGTKEERKNLANELSKTLPEDAESVNALFLTHAHLDHIGRLPNLIDAGYANKIYSTKGTKELSQPMLQMQLRYKERTWYWVNEENPKYIKGHWAPACKSLHSDIKYKDFPRQWHWTKNLSRNKGGEYLNAHWGKGCKYAKKISSNNLASSRHAITFKKLKLEFSNLLVKKCGLCGEKETEIVKTNLNKSTLLTSSFGMPENIEAKINLNPPQNLNSSLSPCNDNGNIGFSPCKECANCDLKPILNLIEVVQINAPIQIAFGVTATPIDAGHIPGSCSWFFDFDLPTHKGTVLFSGDLGNPNSTLIDGPEPALLADVVFMENTYGCPHEEEGGKSAQESLKDFRVDVADILNQNGIAWIPAFALDRSQKVLHQIRIAQREGLIEEDIPIFMPSPTGTWVSKIYDDNRHAGWFRTTWSDDSSNLKLLKLDEKPFIKDGGDIPTPSIIITTSGMMESVYSKSLIPCLADRTDVRLFLVGYQDPKSDGGVIQEHLTGADILEEYRHDLGNGESVVFNAGVRDVGGFSSHAQDKDLLKWLERQDIYQTQLFLVHGENETLEDRKKCLTDNGWKNVIVPKAGNEYILDLRRVDED